MDELINEWLQTYEPISEIAEYEELHNERGTDVVKNLALQRTGFENLPLKYITDSGWYRQYQYMLLLKSTSEVDEQRLANLDWLDKFSNWIEEKKKARELPQLEDGRIVKNVSCANALTYQESEDGAVSVYSLQLYFDIRKEN
jgi:hypothetical protein